VVLLLVCHNVSICAYSVLCSIPGTICTGLLGCTGGVVLLVVFISTQVVCRSPGVLVFFITRSDGGVGVCTTRYPLIRMGPRSCMLPLVWCAVVVVWMPLLVRLVVSGYLWLLLLGVVLSESVMP